MKSDNGDDQAPDSTPSPGRGQEATPWSSSLTALLPSSSATMEIANDTDRRRLNYVKATKKGIGTKRYTPVTEEERRKLSKVIKDRVIIDKKLLKRAEMSEINLW